MKIAIVGLGLLGGSIGLRLRQKGHFVLGIEHNEQHAAQALRLGLVDEIVTMSSGVKQTDVIYLAIPVDAIEELLPKILNDINRKQIVTDTGSTKGAVCKAVVNHLNRGRYVAGHPLAGTEFSGPSAALADLFEGKKNLICDVNISDRDAVETIELLNTDLGMTSQYMESAIHDKHLAYVSHLSHVSSFMLGMTVLDIEEDEEQIFELAGTGFGSTVRLAKSAPETWAPIFKKNKKYLSRALGEYIEHLMIFKMHIEEGNTEKMLEAMIQANQIKRILQKR